MKINSIFQAIEGEGIDIGTPKVFIRTQGCSMNCVNCDTPEAQDSKKGKKMTVKQIVDKVRKFKQKHITITGGDPMQQNHNELLELIKEFKRVNQNYHITLEVTGNDERDNVIDKIFNKVDFLSFDMKSPSSKSALPFHKSSIGWNHKSQYKIVIERWDDYDFAKRMIKKYKMCDIVLTPCWKPDEILNEDFIKKLHEKILKDGLKCKVIIQQHKIVYGAKKKNV